MFLKIAEKHGMSPEELKQRAVQAYRFRQDSLPQEKPAPKKIRKNKNKIKA
jgi:hypothetical protein